MMHSTVNMSLGIWLFMAMLLNKEELNQTEHLACSGMRTGVAFLTHNSWVS